ncbi:MAG: hypothetical protein PHP98_11420 [Kiritimatiellae bacterium]|nr:hypothetical protein [Kiritimatiellia bacterium]
MKFLKYFCLLPSAFCLLLLAGCEWTAGGDMATWNDRENYADFSGAYKASDGGVLVRAPGVGPGSITNTVTATNSVAGELLGTGDGINTAFSSVLAHPPPKSGTLTIVAGGYRFADPGSASAGTVALTVTPADGSSGSLNLNTGVWTLSFPAPLASGTQILGAYQYLSTSNIVIASQGNHGDPIYTFILYQQGNTIQITDDCGSKYEGYIGSVRTTGGVPIDLDPSNPGTAPVSGSIVAQLYATGYSQGYAVQITGTLQGTLSDATLSGRKLQATFVETGGYAADVAGTAQ